MTMTPEEQQTLLNVIETSRRIVDGMITANDSVRYLIPAVINYQVGQTIIAKLDELIAALKPVVTHGGPGGGNHGN